MKQFIYKFCMLVILFASFSALSHAQTPSINSGGIGNYDGTTPTNHNKYWSIYGSNLSSGSGSANVYFTWGEWDGFSETTLITHQNHLTSSNCCFYWYESSSQINFLSQPYANTYFYFYPRAYVYVCVSGLCSGNEFFYFV